MSSEVNLNGQVPVSTYPLVAFGVFQGFIEKSKFFPVQVLQVPCMLQHA